MIDWYGGTLVSRLNDKRTGSIIAVMQRLHEDDLAGHLLRQGGWNHLNTPAIALEEETIELGRGGTHCAGVAILQKPAALVCCVRAARRVFSSLAPRKRGRARPHGGAAESATGNS